MSGELDSCSPRIWDEVCVPTPEHLVTAYSSSEGKELLIEGTAQRRKGPLQRGVPCPEMVSQVDRGQQYGCPGRLSQGPIWHQH